MLVENGYLRGGGWQTGLRGPRWTLAFSECGLLYNFSLTEYKIGELKNTELFKETLQYNIMTVHPKRDTT